MKELSDLITRTPTRRCARCGALVGTATSVEPGRGDARPGDVVVCAVCGQLQIVDESLGLRPATLAEQRALQREPARLWRVVCRALDNPPV